MFRLRGPELSVWSGMAKKSWVVDSNPHQEPVRRVAEVAPHASGRTGVSGPVGAQGVQGAAGPSGPVLGKVIEGPVLHHCPDCHAILLVLSRNELPADVRLQFIKHLT